MRQIVALALGLILIGQTATSSPSFCILGAIASGFTFPFGPEILKGRERVEFVGNPPASQSVPKRSFSWSVRVSVSH